MGFDRDAGFVTELMATRDAFRRQSADRYDWVWFHDVFRLRACLDLLHSSQKIILQPHSPESAGDELENAGGTSYDVQWVRHAEMEAFSRADVCVLPHQGAFPIFQPLLRPSTRVEYVLSGCRALPFRCLIPLDEKLVFYLFIGRRIPIKGFDLIMDAFQAARREDDRLRLILVGAGEPSTLPGVVDIGRSNSAADWLASCDYMISANRESYFDLSVMEALSHGTPLLLAPTGGHKFFTDIVSPGIALTPRLDSRGIAEIMLGNTLKRSVEPGRSSANRSLFDDVFSTDHYRRRVNSMLSRLILG